MLILRRCPLLAQSRHRLVHCTCPLSGVKRTCLFALHLSAFDPKRTLTSSSASLSRYKRRGPLRRAYATAPLHHTSRRHSNALAAHRSCTTGRARATHRRAHPIHSRPSGGRGTNSAVRAEPPAVGMDGWARPADRTSLARGRGRFYPPCRAELVALAPDVLLVVGTATAALLLQATQTIPVVFVQ